MHASFGSLVAEGLRRIWQREFVPELEVDTDRIDLEALLVSRTQRWWLDVVAI